MSDSLSVVIVLASMKQELAVPVMAQSLAVLMNEYQFGFRGIGGVSSLLFDKTEYKYEGGISETFLSATALDVEAIQKLAEHYHWFSIYGSIRIPSRGITLYPTSLILYPTFDPINPVCIVFELGPSLYRQVYEDDDFNDHFDKDAADVLFQLTVRLGANDQTDGFRMSCVGSLDEIKTFDVVALRHHLLHPPSIQDVMKGDALNYSYITGIKASILSLDEMKRICIYGDTFLTLNGFSVLNELVEIDDDDDDDCEND